MTNRTKSEHVFKDPAFPLTVMRLENHGNTAVHSHEFHELVVILEGRGRHIADGQEYQIDAGDVFLIRGDMKHGYADTDRMTLVNILFDPRRLRLPLSYLEDLPGYQALFRVEPGLRAHEGFRNRLRLSEEYLAEAAGMIFRLQQELKDCKPGYRFHACAYLMSLIGFLSRCFGHATEHAGRPMLRMGEVLSYIEQHYREQVTVKDLTRIAHMSESTLMRTFRRVLGRSPVAHVIRVRVLRAADLLQRGGVRATEAAFECGFNDSNYFSRQFRRVLGVSPREYRTRYLSPGAAARKARKEPSMSRSPRRKKSRRT